MLDAAVVDALGHDRLLAHVWTQTGRAGRGWSFPLLVGAWDDPVVDSPSVQLWVPQSGDGLPVVEGVFSQVLKGARASFVGAVPTCLPAERQQRLAGADLESAAVHWVDANGRWGGVP